MIVDSGNRAQKPFLGERQPRVGRMLDTFMDWLVQSSLVRPPRSSVNGRFGIFSRSYPDN